MDTKFNILICRLSVTDSKYSEQFEYVTLEDFYFKGHLL